MTGLRAGAAPPPCDEAATPPRFVVNAARSSQLEQDGTLLVEGGIRRYLVPPPLGVLLASILRALPDARDEAALVAATGRTPDELARGLEMLRLSGAVLRVADLPSSPATAWLVPRLGNEIDSLKRWGRPIAAGQLTAITFAVHGSLEWASRLAAGLRALGYPAYLTDPQPITGRSGATEAPTVHLLDYDAQWSAGEGERALFAGSVGGVLSVGPWCHGNGADLCPACVGSSLGAAGATEADAFAMLASMISAELVRDAYLITGVGQRQARTFDRAQLLTSEVPVLRRLNCPTCGADRRFDEQVAEFFSFEQLVGPARVAQAAPVVLTSVDQARQDDLLTVEALGKDATAVPLDTTVQAIVLDAAGGRPDGDTWQFAMPTAGNLRSVKLYAAGEPATLYLHDAIGNTYHPARRLSPAAATALGSPSPGSPAPGSPASGSAAAGSPANLLLTTAAARLERKYGALGRRLGCLDAGAAIAVLSVAAAAHGYRAVPDLQVSQLQQLFQLDPSHDSPQAVIRWKPAAAGQLDALARLAPVLGRRRSVREYTAESLDLDAIRVAANAAGAAFGQLWEPVTAGIPLPTLSIFGYRCGSPTGGATVLQAGHGCCEPRITVADSGRLPRPETYLQPDLAEAAALLFVELDVNRLAADFGEDAYRVGLQAACCYLTLLWLQLTDSDLGLSPFGPALDWILDAALPPGAGHRRGADYALATAAIGRAAVR